MIYIVLKGGLGNQLFQLAHGYALAVDANQQVVLDLSNLGSERRNTTQRHFALNFFEVNSRFATGPESSSIRLALLMNKFGVQHSKYRVLCERGRPTGATFVDERHTISVGYWQDETYFFACKSQIAEMLFKHTVLSEPKQALLCEITSGEAASVHVRRGDYLTSTAANTYHGILDVDYYRRATALLHGTGEKLNYFVFSDDIEWCRSNLGFLGAGARFVDSTGSEAAWEDLVLMSHCRHHVIANSSFSWWAAWLSEQRCRDENTIIAPSKWFRSRRANNEFHLPERWLRA